MVKMVQGHLNRMTVRDMLILYPVLFTIFAYILWYGPDSFQTVKEVLR